MFSSIWKIIVGLCWRLGKTRALVPPSSIDHAKESLHGLQLERMQSLMRLVDEKALLDAKSKKIELLKSLINNDVDNDVYKTLTNMDIMATITLSPQESTTRPSLPDNPMFSGLQNVSEFKKTKTFSTINH